jgi:hypothetical protein
VTTNNNNICIGSQAGTRGDNNICIGPSAGVLSTGSDNIFIGTEAGVDISGAAAASCIAIGLTMNPGPMVLSAIIGTDSGINIDVTSGASMDSIYSFGTTNTFGSGTLFMSGVTAVGQSIDMHPNGGTVGAAEIVDVSAFGNQLDIGRGTNAVIVGKSSSGNLIRNYEGQVCLVNEGARASLHGNGAFQITSSLAIKPGGGSWTATSDRRLKANIISANVITCENLIRNLDLKRYTWDDQVPGDDRTQLGWIAQEVEQYLPKAIVKKNLYGLEDCHLLDSSQITMAMYGALKRCISRIDELESVVARNNLQ